MLHFFHFPLEHNNPLVLSNATPQLLTRHHWFSWSGKSMILLISNFLYMYMYYERVYVVLAGADFANFCFWNGSGRLTDRRGL